MLTRNVIGRKAVATGFKGIVPGGPNIVPLIGLILEHKLQTRVFEAPVEKFALSQHIERVCREVREGFYVPGVSTGEIGEFFIHLKANPDLWDEFQKAAKDETVM